MKITWKYADNTGELDNIHLEPHQKGNIVIPGMDWQNGKKLNLCFFQNDTTLVDEYNIQLGTIKVDLPVCLNGELKMEDQGKLILVQGREFSLSVNKRSGLLENVVVENDTLIKSGPYINLKIPGKRAQYSTIVMDDMAKNWQCDNFDYEVKDGILNLYTSGKYDNLSTDFHIQVDENGTIITEYKVKDAPEGNGIQEQGLLFYTGEQFHTLAWDRVAYFTAYPETDMGKPQGEIALDDKPEMKYRNYPEHAWSLDTRNFYYHGLEKELPLTNTARSLKENIYTFTIKAGGASQLQVVDTGTKACRFDKINGEYLLLINDQWDYTSLLWGNYMKKLKSKKEFQGVVVLRIESY